jgi:hypothetical protein
MDTENARRDGGGHIEREIKMIKHAIIADPQASDNKIAKKVGVSQPTVTKVRTETHGQNSKTLKNDHSPIDRAKAARAAEA